MKKTEPKNLSVLERDPFVIRWPRSNWTMEFTSTLPAAELAFLTVIAIARNGPHELGHALHERGLDGYLDIELFFNSDAESAMGNLKTLGRDLYRLDDGRYVDPETLPEIFHDQSSGDPDEVERDDVRASSDEFE